MTIKDLYRFIIWKTQGLQGMHLKREIPYKLKWISKWNKEYPHGGISWQRETSNLNQNENRKV